MKRLLFFLFLLPAACSGFTAVKFKVANYNMQIARQIIDERIANGTFEFIEGIWRNDEGKTFAIERFFDGRLPEEFRYRAIQLDGSKEEIGMVKHFFETTNFDNIYHITDENPFGNAFSETYIQIEENEFVYYQPNWKRHVFYRLYPMIDLSGESDDENSGCGSGFALTEDGYIVTCAHVSQNGKKIFITGAGNDFSQFYNARIVAEDVKNDIAILKIEDENFTSFGKIPYNIRETNPVDGEFCFAIGFPQISILGYSPKVTTGIVSTSHDTSKPNSFQMTTPIESGNSGGAIFDKNGNIIGIAKSKYLQLYTNLSVRTDYLRNFVYSCPELQHLQMTPAPEGREMTEIVATNKPFTVLIFVNVDPREPSSSTPNRTRYRFKKNIERTEPIDDAVRLFSNGQFEDAIKILNQELEQNPKNSAAYFLRERCWFGLGNLQNSYIDIQQAILYFDSNYGDKKDLAVLYEEKAAIQVHLGNIDGASESIENAIKLDSKNYILLLSKGNILYRMQQYKKALQVLNKALSAPECLAPGYYLRGLVYEALGDMNKALSDMKQAAQLGNDEAQKWLLQP